MLPIFRTISVGGVFLAIAILGLALTPPGVSKMRMAAVDAPASGALLDRNRHPEWRQFIVQAALRRADAISALRDLPDTAVRLPQIPDVAPPYETPVFPNLSPGETERFVGLPAKDRGDPEDITGTIKPAPAPIPIEIGETSSTELPAFSPDDSPPANRLPRSEMPAAKVSALEPAPPAKPPQATRKKVAPRHRAAAVKPQTLNPMDYPVPPPFNILQAIFQSFANQPNAANTPGSGRVTRGQARANTSKPVHTVTE